MALTLWTLLRGHRGIEQEPLESTHRPSEATENRLIRTVTAATIRNCSDPVRSAGCQRLHREIRRGSRQSQERHGYRAHRQSMMVASANRQCRCQPRARHRQRNPYPRRPPRPDHGPLKRRDSQFLGAQSFTANAILFRSASPLNGFRPIGPAHTAYNVPNGAASSIPSRRPSTPASSGRCSRSRHTSGIAVI